MTAIQEGAKLPADSRPAFTYHGPPSGVTLGNGEEILLHTGATVHLPEEHEYTRTLLARKHLAPVMPAPKPAKAHKGVVTPSTSTGS